MTYNLTAIVDNTTGFVSFAQGVNSVLLEGFLGILILMGIFAIFFMSLYSKTGDTRRSLGAASFVCFTLSLLLRAMGLLPDIALFITLIGTATIFAFTWRG
jgi:hypothetical protein